MSRFKKLWVLIVPTVLMVTLGATPAHAEPTQPPPPIANDACGTSQDQVYLSAGQAMEQVQWSDQYGTLYGGGMWNSTHSLASITLTATVIDGTTGTYTYPPLTFGTEPDSTCVEAADTVSTRIVQCNTANNGTRVEFVFTNTDDASNRSRNRPELWVDRWDHGQSAAFVLTEGLVPDGAQVSMTGGDSLSGSRPEDFFLAPGTYTIDVRSKDKGMVRMPNRLFVPACGDYKPPKGDPMGGPIPTGKSKPKGVVHLTNCQTGLIKGYTSTKGLPKGGKTIFIYKGPGLKKPVKVKMANGVKKRKPMTFKHVPDRKLIKLYYKKGHKWVLLSKDGNFGCGGS